MPAHRLYASQAARQAAYRERVAARRRQELAAGGRPALPVAAPLPGPPRWRALLRQGQALLQTVQEEMHAYYGQRSSAWQESERGEAFLERLEAVEEAERALDDLS